ncbi:MAG TPA: putative sulfate exporter family transporter, partial [Trebonia sp.]
FAGTAVNDTSSVVATATTYGNSAAGYAVVVKLVRTLMIIPICVGLGVLAARREGSATATGASTAPGGDGAIVSPAGPAVLAGPAVTTAGARMSPRKTLRLVPWFLIGFVVMAAANSAGLMPATWHGSLSQLSLFLVAMALSAIGLSTDVAALRRAGAKPLLLGAMLWVTVAAASLGLQLLTGTLH